MQPSQSGLLGVRGAARLVGLAGALACPAGLSALPAAAADLPLRAAPPPVFVAAPDWSGLYLGAQVGTIVDHGGNGLVASGDGGLIPSPNFGGRGGRTGNALGSFDGRDLFVGGHVGYNWQSGAVVFGVEGDANTLGRIDEVLVSGRGRLGYGTPRFLVYGTAGIAYLSLRSGLAGVFVGGNGGAGGNGGKAGGVAGDGGQGGNGFGVLPVGTPGGDRTGFVGGGGFEMRLSPQVGAGVEALYYSFDGAPLETGMPRDFVTVRGRLTFHLDPVTGAAGLAAGLPPAFAGFYGGGHLGAVDTLSGNTIDRVSLASGEAGAAGIRGIDGGGGGGGGVAFAGIRRSPSVIGGVHAGYNWQSGRIVYGGEADASFSPDDAYSVLGSVRGRLGFIGAGTLFYGTAGVAFGSSEGTRAVFAGNGGNGGDGGAVIAAPGGAGGAGGIALSFRRSDTQTGFVVGGGLEARVTERLIAGAEALYYNFGSSNAPVLPAAGTGRAFVGGGPEEAFVLRTRLSYSFATP